MNELIPVPAAESVTTVVTAFGLIGLAEIGDKSQLVCMTLAARHRGWPILLGAAAAFSLLNLLAVLFGAGVAAWLPQQVAAGLVALLFAGFGIHALRANVDDDEDILEQKPGHGIFFTTFLLIFVAEFGDKTQIAVAALASTSPLVPVWLGATAALAGVSAAGVWLGRRFLQRMPLKWLHRLAGMVFLGLAALAAAQALGLLGTQ
jgi:putative Ca2+/H+ antiporter (TMEM165/GDT1 family)